MHSTIFLASSPWVWPDAHSTACTVSLSFAVASIHNQALYEFRLDRRRDRIYWQDRRELWIRDRLPRSEFRPRPQFIRRPGAGRIRSMRWSRKRKASV